MLRNRHGGLGRDLGGGDLMPMAFNFDDPSKFVTHWMLQSEEVAQAIAATPEFQDGQTTVARVTVNGVELPFELLEDYFRFVYEYTQAEAHRKYADQEALVQERLEQRLQAEANPVLDQLHRLQEILTEAGQIIRPHWEKSNA